MTIERQRVEEMITRFAVFEAHIPAHQHQGFQDAIFERLLPAVRRLPGLMSATASISLERDADAPEIVVFLMTTYPDMGTLKAALDAPERQRAQDITNDIFEEFAPCRIHHHIAKTRPQV
jgi:hypothetical protein